MTKEEYANRLPWLKEIPRTWEVVPLLATSKPKTTKSSVGELLSVYLDRGVIRASEGSLGTHAPSLDLSNYQLIEPGDFILNNQQAWRGSVGVSFERGIISPAYIVLTLSRQLEPRYSNYLFRSNIAVDQFMLASQGVGSIQRQVHAPSLKNVLIIRPPLETQKLIADFLDEKAKIIDGMIEKKEKLIELLREKRAAFITHVVTKGLDPKAKMKPSGIDWLGNIPAKWEIRRGKFIFKYKKEPNSKYQCDHILALTLRGVINKEDYEMHSLTPTDYASYQIFYPNDLVFKLIDLENRQTSRVGIVLQKGIMSPAYLRIVPVAKIAPRFFYWFYYSLYLQGIFNFLGMGVRSTLNQHDLLTQSVTLPSLQEQKQIADFLDAETAKIDKTAALIESQIEQLKEYRSSLIYHAVTGKIRL